MTLLLAVLISNGLFMLFVYLKGNKIMTALDDLKTAVAHDIDIQEKFVTAFLDLKKSLADLQTLVTNLQAQGANSADLVDLGNKLNDEAAKLDAVLNPAPVEPTV